MAATTCQELVPKINNQLLLAAKALDDHFQMKTVMRDSPLSEIQNINDQFDSVVAENNSKTMLPALAAAYDAMLREALGDTYTVSDLFIFLGEREKLQGSNLGFGYRLSQTEYRIIELIKHYYVSPVS